MRDACHPDDAGRIWGVYTDGSAKDLVDLLPLLKRICSYPLAQFNPAIQRDEAWDTLPNWRPGINPRYEREYAKPSLFFLRLADVLDDVPALPGEEDRYNDLEYILTPRYHPVTWSILMEGLHSGAVNSDRDIVSKLICWNRNGKSAGNYWYTPVDPANWWNTADEAMYLERTAIAKSNMFENREEETKYFFTDTDTAGAQLSGSSLYEITFPKGQTLTGHVNKAFWSLTVYDEYHMLNTTNNTANRYSLGTKDEPVLLQPDGSQQLYAGPEPPPGKDKQWIPTPNGELFSLYIRAYWPDDDVRLGKWMPPMVKRIS
ncbi:MAG TPA: DUF1214 domain-containing protein [Gemmata sp.]|nr:DUF1214 domain-containing protein [Gemmata sp.]